MFIRYRNGRRRLGAIAAALALAGLALPSQAFKPTAEFGHVGIVREALARIAVPSSDGISTFRFSERAILEVRDSTAGVDEIVSERGELSVPNAHCDDELLPECTQRIITIKNQAIAALRASPPDGAEARRQVGRALHTLQDFFSHSNWINISAGDPGLGLNVLSRLPAATDTCLRGPSSEGSDTLAGAGLSHATTGYFSLVLAPPEGKCNHGLLLDPGIHKDEPSRVGHGAARAAALNATEGLIRQILAAPGVVGNDKAVRAFLDVRGAVGFIVDDTGSMGAVIAGVKSQIASIVSLVRNSPNPPDRYVLVNFGDPWVGTPLVTADADALLARAQMLYASGGGDCPELAMSGSLRAVNASPDGSQLYLFTDASAKDAAMVGNVIAQANAKKIRMSFLTFGSCSPIDPAYYAIAAQTGGQLFALTRSQSETEKIFALIKSYVSGTPKPMLIAKGAIGGARSIALPVDSSVRSLQVSVAVEGAGEARLFDPSGRELQPGQDGVSITPLSGGRLIAVNAPASGRWRLELSGAGSFDLSVTGDSPVELNRFEFVETRGREGHGGLFAIKSQPLATLVQQGRATLFGAVQSAIYELVNEAGEVIAPLPAQRGALEGSSDEWLASFVLPPQKFRVRVSGQLSNGQAYLRSFPNLFEGRTVKVEALGGGYGSYTPGLTSAIRFQVSNLGAADSFRLSVVDERGYVGAPSPATLNLAQGQSQIVEVAISIPANAALGSTNNVSLSARGSSTANAVVFTQIVRAPSAPGDIDGDGDVDRDDVAIVFAARNIAASGAADPRDLDRNGLINVLDARRVTLLCSRPACARE